MVILYALGFDLTQTRCSCSNLLEWAYCANATVRFMGNFKFVLYLTVLLVLILLHWADLNLPTVCVLEDMEDGPVHMTFMSVLTTGSFGIYLLLCSVFGCDVIAVQMCREPEPRVNLGGAVLD